MWILGISAFYHDSAAALIRDGEVMAPPPRRRLHPQEARFPVPDSCGSVLPGIGRTAAGRSRFGSLLRKAVPEIRASPGKLPGVRSPRAAVFPHGAAPLDPREAVSKGPALPRAGSRVAGVRLGPPAVVHRTPSEQIGRA